MLKAVLMSASAFAATVAMLLVVTPIAQISGSHPAAVPSSGDQYSFGRNVTIGAAVAGSVFVFAGSALISDVIEGDVYVIGGDVRFEGRGRVRGNVIHSGGRLINDTGRVDGGVYGLNTVEGATASLTKSAVILSLLFFWILGAVVLTLASGREVRASSIEIRASMLYCFTLGLVALTSFVLTALVFSYLVPYLIGIPLLAGLAVFAVLTKIYGMVAVFHAVGTVVAGSKSREQLENRRWFRGDLAMVLVGILILGAVRLIPGIGTIAWSVASVFGIGVALATKFGRREPWFLAWRAAEA